MRILLVSKFLHHVGGVETYLRWQANALVGEGHAVAVFGMRPPPDREQMDFDSRIASYHSTYRSFHGSLLDRGVSASASIYSVATGRMLRHAIDEFRPDIVHFHCTCYQLTPSVFQEARRAHLPAFMTAHEYKLVCANQIFFDDRKREICVACLGKSPLAKSRAMMSRACIKGSRGATLIGAVETPVSIALWKAANGVAIAPSRFLQDALVRDGYTNIRYLDLPWEPVVRPNPTSGVNVLFLGRVELHKGILVLLAAWLKIQKTLPSYARLRIAGSGLAEATARQFVVDRGLERVDFLGYLAPSEVKRELDLAAMTVHPAQWFENSPYSVRESLTHGVPALVSSIGGAKELVSAATGGVIEPGRPDLWADAIIAEWSQRRAGSAALLDAVNDRRTTGAEHLAGLLDLYQECRRS